LKFGFFDSGVDNVMRWSSRVVPTIKEVVVLWWRNTKNATKALHVGFILGVKLELLWA